MFTESFCLLLIQANLNWSQHLLLMRIISDQSFLICCIREIDPFGFHLSCTWIKYVSLKTGIFNHMELLHWEVFRTVHLHRSSSWEQESKGFYLPHLKSSGVKTHLDEGLKLLLLVAMGLLWPLSRPADQFHFFLVRPLFYLSLSDLFLGMCWIAGALLYSTPTSKQDLICYNLQALGQVSRIGITVHAVTLCSLL